MGITENFTQKLIFYTNLILRVKTILVQQLLFIFSKTKDLVCINYILASFFLIILTLKILNLVLYNCIQDNPIFTSIFFYFCHNVLMHEFKRCINM